MEMNNIFLKESFKIQKELFSKFTTCPNIGDTVKCYSHFGFNCFTWGTLSLKIVVPLKKKPCIFQELFMGAKYNFRAAYE